MANHASLAAAERDVRKADLGVKLAKFKLQLRKARESEEQAKENLADAERDVRLGRESAASELEEVQLELAEATAARKRVQLEIAKLKDQLEKIVGEQEGGERQ